SLRHTKAERCQCFRPSTFQSRSNMSRNEGSWQSTVETTAPAIVFASVLLNCRNRADFPQNPLFRSMRQLARFSALVHLRETMNLRGVGWLLGGSGRVRKLR